MNRNRGLLTLMIAGPFLLWGCGPSGPAGGDGHDDDKGSHIDDHADEHADEGHDEGEGGHNDVVTLSPEQLERAGVRIEPLSGGWIATHLVLPAEVGLNEDTLVHVTPRAPGIVAEVREFLGQRVQAGDVLAVLQSPGLGEAKIEYLQARQSSESARAELERQRTISQNTETLLGLLKASLTLEELRMKTEDLRIGENKGRLLSAYAKLRAAEANYAREKLLAEKQLSMEAELLASREAFNSSQADYFAAFEEVDFTFRLRLQNAERAAQVAASEVQNAERRLHLLGLGEDQVESVAEEPDADIARYELKAPASGTIVAKHLSPGEMLSGDSSVYTIADLSSVWLNISVYARYMDQIRMGQQVLVTADGRTATGRVEYLSPVIDEGSRTVAARVILDNAGEVWRPGEFVTVRVQTERVQVARSVPLEAVQTFEGREVVFVQDDDGIEPVAVVLGRRNDEFVELLGEEPPLGSPVVVSNAFLMKAELGKGAAGHDH